MDIIMKESARNSIKNISKYLWNISKLYDYIDKLKYFPEMGRCVPEFNRKEIRELIYHKYRILYEVSRKNQQIIVYYIIHSRVDLNKFLNGNNNIL